MMLQLSSFAVGSSAHPEHVSGSIGQQGHWDNFVSEAQEEREAVEGEARHQIPAGMGQEQGGMTRMTAYTEST